MHNFTSSGPRFSQLCTIKGYVSFRINQKPVVSNFGNTLSYCLS